MGTIDVEKAKAYQFTPLTFEVERGRLRAFARAIGETNPIYSDVEAARAAGHRDVLVPPTFFFSMTLEVPDPFGYITDLGADMRFVLHGEQRFDYHQLAYAGDVLVLQDRITDVYDKRGGAMEFIVRETEVHRQTDAGEDLVATAICTTVVRHPEVTA